MIIERKSDYILPALVASLLLHFMFGWTISQPKLVTLPEVKVINVDLVRSISQPKKKQIVSPSDKTLEKTPENPRFLSERDSFAEKEQIRRGNPDAGPAKNVAQEMQTANDAQSESQRQSKPQPQSQPQPKTPPTQQNKQQSTTEKSKPAAAKKSTALFAKTANSNRKLDLSTDRDLLTDLSKQVAAKDGSSKNAAAATQPFSRAPGSSARIFGYQGSLDYLPQVTDGDLTLLNAKADKFAVFVRRVAIRVFNLLKQYGWDYLSARDFNSLSRFSTIEATLDPQGKFLRLRINSSSGSTSFDRILERSVSEGANDPNPPAAAKAQDGNYRFIFQARSWSQTVPGGRNGPLQERRWLMLQTGLE